MEPVSFIAWITSLVSSLKFQQFIVYILAGFVGIYSHYVKKWLEDEVKGGFGKYLFGDHPKHTIATVLTFIGSGVTYVFMGTEVANWPSLLTLSFTMGYSLDSAINKGGKEPNEPTLPKE